MNSPNQKSSKNKILYIFIIFLAISCLIFFFKDSVPIKFIQGKMQQIIASHKITFFSLGKNEKIDSVQVLKSEIDRLNQKLVDFEIIKKDNEALKSQFEISGSASQTLANAKILGFTGDNKLPQTLVINLGEKSGIKEGMSVVTQRYLVGKISAVSENFSVVETVLSPNFQALAKLPETNANGILKGSRDFMLLDRVVITDVLKKGADVVTRGEVEATGIGIFPDLIIGKVTSISKNETAPFQSAQVAPIIDLSRLTNVFVIVSL